MKQEAKIMEFEKDPIELKSGELGCPRCITQLVNGKVPYFVFGIRVGEFDGLLCEICRYGLLSEKGYEDSGKKVAELCLIEQEVNVTDLYDKPIESSEIIDNKIPDVSRLVITQNEIEQFLLKKKVNLEGRNLTKYSMELPTITATWKKKSPKN